MCCRGAGPTAQSGRAVTSGPRRTIPRTSRAPGTRCGPCAAIHLPCVWCLATPSRAQDCCGTDQHATAEHFVNGWHWRRHSLPKGLVRSDTFASEISALKGTPGGEGGGGCQALPTLLRPPIEPYPPNEMNGCTGGHLSVDRATLPQIKSGPKALFRGRAGGGWVSQQDVLQSDRRAPQIFFASVVPRRTHP